MLQECIERIVANPEVQARTGLTPAQAAIIALSGVTVLGVAMVIYFVPAARNFVLNILGNGYSRVMQAIGFLDTLTGGRLSSLQSQVSSAWSGFTYYMSQAWARLVCWANGNPGEVILAEAQEMVPLNRRIGNNNRTSEACREPHEANRENGQEILRPAPPVPRSPPPRKSDLERGDLADDEASDRLLTPPLDASQPLDPAPEEQCEGLDMLGKLADQLAAVGRCPVPAKARKVMEGHDTVVEEEMSSEIEDPQVTMLKLINF